MFGRGYVMNVGRGYIRNVGRGYVIQNSESASESVTKVGIELQGSLFYIISGETSREKTPTFS